MPVRGQPVRIAWVLCSLLIAQLALPPGLVLTRCTKTGALSWRPAMLCACPLLADRGLGNSVSGAPATDQASRAETPCPRPVDDEDSEGCSDCGEVLSTSAACECCAPFAEEAVPDPCCQSCLEVERQACGCCVDLFVCALEAEQAPVDATGSLAMGLAPESVRPAIRPASSLAALSVRRAPTPAAIDPPPIKRPLLI